MKASLFAFTLATLTLAAASAHASDNYKLFRFDLALEGVHQPDAGAWGGGVVLEPMFNVHDQVSVGARFEAFGSGGGSAGPSGTSFGVGVGEAALAKGEFYFTQSSVRPYAGLGLGIYHLGGQSVSASAAGAGIEQEASSHFGIAPSIGIELSIFRIGLTYNFLLGSSSSVSQSVMAGAGGSSVQQTVNGDSPSSSYVALELGFRFGGGRRAEASPEKRE